MEEKSLVRDVLPSNSNKTKKTKVEAEVKNEKPKQKPIVKSAKKRKKTIGEKFTEAFVGSDGGNIGEYIIHDVLVPALKATISDAVIGGMEMLVFGEKRSNSRNRSYRDKERTFTSYSDYYDNKDRGRSRDKNISRGARARHDFDDVIFETRSEAEEVLIHLSDLTVDNGLATVADFYVLSGIESQFTDNKYGWTSLRGACTDRVRNGYIIRLPQPKTID